MLRWYRRPKKKHVDLATRLATLGVIITLIQQVYSLRHDIKAESEERKRVNQRHERKLNEISSNVATNAAEIEAARDGF